MVLSVLSFMRGCTVNFILSLVLIELSLRSFGAEARPVLTIAGINQAKGSTSNVKPHLTKNFQAQQVKHNASVLNENISPALGTTFDIRRGYNFGVRAKQDTRVWLPTNNTKFGRGSSLRKALLSLQNPRLLGGDILVRSGGARRKDRWIKFERSALVSSVSLWPNGIIFYELDSSVDHLSDMIWKMMQQFHDGTCIRFMPRKYDEPDYLRIEALKGCFSYIGRIGGEQILSLGDGCEYRGTISHELLHAVGFFHHQNRSDRDDHLEILWDNIAKGKENQFLKMAPQENILLNDFDYNSIMLYGPRTFGKDLNSITIVPKREGVSLLEVVEKQGLSSLDIDSVNKLYNCNNSNR